MTCLEKRLRQLNEEKGKYRDVGCLKLLGTPETFGSPLEQETGDFRAVVKFQQGCGHKITDWDKVS